MSPIETRGLAAHIQGIAYSADFPTAVAIGSDIDAVPNKSPYLTPVGSINGLTYLFRFVLAKTPNYIGFESNLYAARQVNQLLQPLIANDDQAKQFADLISQAKHEEAATLLDKVWGTLDKELIFPMQYLSYCFHSNIRRGICRTNLKAEMNFRTPNSEWIACSV